MEKYYGRCTVERADYVINVLLWPWKEAITGEGSLKTLKTEFSNLLKADLVQDINLGVYPEPNLKYGRRYEVQGAISNVQENGELKSFKANIELVDYMSRSNPWRLFGDNIDYFFKITEFNWLD